MYVERFIQTLQRECLDYFVVFGERHLNYLVQEMVAHYHEEWPHQGRNNQPLPQAGADPHKAARKRRKAAEPPPDVVPVSSITCRSRMGGLLKHYSRKAA